VVCEDANLREAIEGAAAIKFMRVAGQSCICANRIYVQDSIAARFIPAFIDRVRAIQVGDGFQPGVEVGPLINEATLHKVESLVQDAVAKGAQVAVGGQRLRTGALRHGWFYAPTVLLDVRDEMPVCQEEIFGPVAPVLTFRTEAELIARQCYNLWSGQLCLYAGLRADHPPRGSAGIRPGGRQRRHGLHARNSLWRLQGKRPGA
jgi:acyl-CoA reductase-like NAD-dependent aldehyde dehydrogenase